MMLVWGGIVPLRPAVILLDETDNQPKRKRKKEKKITLKDMDRKVITERDG